MISIEAAFPQPRAIFRHHLLSSRNPGIVDAGRHTDRRSWGILGGRFSNRSLSCASAATFPHAIALPLGGDHGRMMGEPIEQRRRELFVAGKHRDPFRKREIRRHDRGPSLVPIGDQIEEQLAADAVKGHEAELVDNEDVDAQEALLQARELTRVTRFQELPDEIRRARKEDTAFLFRRFDAERYRQVRFPVPIGPAKIRFSGAVTHSPRASV